MPLSPAELALVFEPTTLVYAGFALAAFFVGLLVALTGVGGGSLMTPILLAGGVPTTLAVGTDLLFAGAIKSFAALKLAFTRSVDFKLVGQLACGSLPGAALGLWIVSSLSTVQAASLMKLVLGVLLVLTALTCLRGGLKMGFNRALQRSESRKVRISPKKSTAVSALGLAAAGFVVGIVVAISSVGAGAVLMSVLLFLYPDREPRELVAVDIAHAVPLAFLAGAGHAALGHVNVLLLGALVAGALPGIFLGLKLARHVPGSALKSGIGILLGAIGIKYLVAL